MSWLRSLLPDQVSSDAVPVLLAPMAGVNDIAFRQLCVECGVDLTYTEMVSSKALSFANEKTRHLLDRASNESRVAVQLSAMSRIPWPARPHGSKNRWAMRSRI